MSRSTRPVLPFFIVSSILLFSFLNRVSGQPPQKIIQHLRPAWSPYGRTIAYLSNKTGTYQLYLFEQKLGQSRQISAAGEDVTQFKWSPKGHQLAYISSGNLFVLYTDGSGVAQLMTSTANPLFFSWTPDGAGITYNCLIKGNPSDICLKNFSNHLDLELVGHPAVDRNFSWSPDGRLLAFGSDRDGDLDIYGLNTITQETTQLTRLPNNTFDPVFSPDGKHLAFISDKDGDNKNFDVYVLHIEKKLLRKISDAGGYNLPLWFPDSERLLITSNRNGKWEIYRTDLKGTSSEKLRDGIAFSISPDGSKILVQSDETGRNRILITDTNGKNSHLLTGL